ncbi:MAG: hypothetical protein H0X24_01270 [Ktedonobacterales bacterium]|nr:hypothetical protein [Ktedonobacterales bacterium]
MPNYCAKCADRAVAYRATALLYLDQATRTLDRLRERLRQHPPLAEILAGPYLHADLLHSSLTPRDLSRIVALGQAIASKPSADRESYSLTVRYTFPPTLPERPFPLTYHAVIVYTWPPPPQQWTCFLVRLYEPTAWFDEQGYRLCWCAHPNEE